MHVAQPPTETILRESIYNIASLSWRQLLNVAMRRSGLEAATTAA